MIKSSIICFFMLLVFFCGSLFAGGSTEVKLTDGSVISGEIVSFSDGVYTVRSGILGTIKINESKIEVIRLKSPGTTARKSVSPLKNSTNKKVHSIQESIMLDQNIMALIFSLQNDPDIQELLNDPAILNAVNSGDFTTLMSNPKFINILQNPTIQEIQKEVTNK
jgi:hypothetical protein